MDGQLTKFRQMLLATTGHHAQRVSMGAWLLAQREAAEARLLNMTTH